MNLQIQQLAEQAHSYACEYAQQPDYNEHNPYNQGMYKQRYDSKFAQLIVQECSRVAKLEVGTNRVCDAIEKHFGVAE
jgi:hypothetical protein